MSSLHARPLTLRMANKMVSEVHRHHKPDVGHRFSIGAYVDDDLVGVAIAGRPKGRMLDQNNDIEVTRVATNGHHNACSFLLGRICRAASAMEFLRVFTYTLEEEPGTSLIAAGFVCDGVVRPNGVGWCNRKGRQSENQGKKVRWHKVLNRRSAKRQTVG